MIFSATVITILAIISFGIYSRYAHSRSAATDTSGPLQPLTPLESLTVSPVKLVFKEQPLGITSSPQIVTVINRANAPRIITGIKISENFAQTNDCPQELMVGDSCNFEVTFTPATIGLTHGSLEISCVDLLFSSATLWATVDFSGSGENASTPSPVGIEPTKSDEHLVGECYLTFAGQIFNRTVPVMIVNQTPEPVDDVRMDVMQLLDKPKNNSDPNPNSKLVGWEKRLDIGTCRARLSDGLEQRFPVGSYDHQSYSVWISSRYWTFRETIDLNKRTEREYGVKIAVYRGGNNKPVKEIDTVIYAAMP